MVRQCLLLRWSLSIAACPMGLRLMDAIPVVLGSWSALTPADVLLAQHTSGQRRAKHCDALRRQLHKETRAIVHGIMTTELCQPCPTRTSAAERESSVC